MKSFAVPGSWPKLRTWLPMAVLVTGLGLTLAATFYHTEFANARDRRRFEVAANEIQEKVQSRLEAYIALLRGGSALLTVKPDLDWEDWRAYVQRLRVEEFYPGVQGIGVSFRIKADQTNQLVARMRQEGVTNFHIRPDTPRAEYHAITYLHPLDRRNVAALGYDMFTEATRRAAMEQAAKTGAPVASGKVRLVQEIEEPEQAGFLIYVPVYGEGEVPQNQAERWAKLRGFVYSPFRAGDFFSGLFSESEQPELEIEVYDGAKASPGALLHHFPAAKHAENPRFELVRQINVASRPWSIGFSSLGKFEQRSTELLRALIPLGGTLLSLLLYYFTRREAVARQAVETSAADLAEQREHLRVRAEAAATFATANLSFKEVLQRCAELLVQRVPAAFARIWTLNPETDVLELQASAGMYTHLHGPHSRVPLGKYKIGLIAKEARPHLTNSVLTDPRISDPEWARAEGMVAFAGYPLISGGRVIGVMALFARKALQETTVSLLGGMADIVAQGIQRKRAEDALEEANRDLERRVAERTANLEEAVAELEAFSYSVSHDMRAPLRAMQSFSLILKEEAGGKLTDEEQAYLERIIKASDRLDQLIHDVLAYSRISRNPLELHGVDVEKTAQEVIQQHPSLQQPNAEILIDSPTLRVLGDKASLTQCFSNLLTNAVKFVAPGTKPRVRIRTEAIDGDVRLWVEDNGIGIPAEYRDKIFGLFQRLHAATAYEGTGIGLAIVKKAVQRMGGQVGVESEEGKGSRFWIQLRRAR